MTYFGRMTPEARERRDNLILELWAMGWTRERIASDPRVDVTPSRVSQIVANFGKSFR